MTWQQLDDGRIVRVQPKPMRGLGDLVARATGLLGIPSCNACEQRQAFLNQAFPLRGRKQ